MTNYIATYNVPIYFTVAAADTKEEAREFADEHIKRVIRRINEEDRMGPAFDTADYQLTELISEDDL
jgi:alkanesulfonate monooxygenase SsuD/methylene tetrahydromethanopterin reductase-like flavin-dependent oxidoreductase (luciferase family)